MAEELHQDLCEEVSSLSEMEFDEYQQGCGSRERELHAWIRGQLQKNGTANITAFDNGRLIQLARWCERAGYLTKKKAWDWILRAAQRAQSTYHSWEDYADHYDAGYRFWRLGDEEEDALGGFQEGLHWLKTDSKSPWRDLEWRTSLDLSGE